MIVCHTAVDPSVVTQPPVTLTSEMTAVCIYNRQPSFTELHRGVRIQRIRVGILSFPRPSVDNMAARPYIPLPRWIQTMRAVVNVTGTGDDCFKLAILAGMQPVDVNPHRKGMYGEHMGK